MKQEEFAVAMKHLAIAFGKQFTKDETEVYYEYLKMYSYGVLKNAITEIISKEKFMPKIADLKEYCEKNKQITRFAIIEQMNKQGYFRSPQEYDKASKWLDSGVIPEWFKEEMKKYKSNYLEHTKRIKCGTE